MDETTDEIKILNYLSKVHRKDSKISLIGVSEQVIGENTGVLFVKPHLEELRAKALVGDVGTGFILTEAGIEYMKVDDAALKQPDNKRFAGLNQWIWNHIIVAITVGIISSLIAGIVLILIQR